MRKTLTVIAALAIALSLVACKGGNKGIKLGEKHEVGDDASFSIHAADQKSNGKAVKIPEAYLKEKGYMVIHAYAGGTPGEVIGVSELLQAGEAENIRVKLEKKLSTSANVWPMLHTENNNNSTYDGVAVDLPAKVNNAVVTVKIRVTLR